MRIGYLTVVLAHARWCIADTGVDRRRYLSDHFAIESHFRLRCAFTWRQPGEEEDAAELFKTAQSGVVAPRFTAIDRLFHRHFTVRGALALAAAVVACTVAVVGFEQHAIVRACVVALAVAIHSVAFLLVSRFRHASHERSSKEEEEEVSHDDDDDDIDSTSVVEPHPAPRLDPGVIDPYASFHRSAREHYDSPCLGERSVRPDGTRGPYVWLT